MFSSLFKDKKSFPVLFAKSTNATDGPQEYAKGGRRDVVAEEAKLRPTNNRTQQHPVREEPPQRPTQKLILTTQNRCQRCWKSFTAECRSDDDVWDYTCAMCEYAICPRCREVPQRQGYGTTWVCCSCNNPMSLMRLFETTKQGPALVVRIVAYCDARSQRILKSFFPTAALMMAAAAAVSRSPSPRSASRSKSISTLDSAIARVRAEQRRRHIEAAPRNTSPHLAIAESPQQVEARPHIPRMSIEQDDLRACPLFEEAPPHRQLSPCEYSLSTTSPSMEPQPHRSHHHGTVAPSTAAMMISMAHEDKENMPSPPAHTHHNARLLGSPTTTRGGLATLHDSAPGSSTFRAAATTFGSIAPEMNSYRDPVQRLSFTPETTPERQHFERCEPSLRWSGGRDQSVPTTPERVASAELANRHRDVFGEDRSLSAEVAGRYVLGMSPEAHVAAARSDNNNSSSAGPATTEDLRVSESTISASTSAARGHAFEREPLHHRHLAADETMSGGVPSGRSPARSESPAPRFPTFAEFLDDHHQLIKAGLADGVQHNATGSGGVVVSPATASEVVVELGLRPNNNGSTHTQRSATPRQVEVHEVADAPSPSVAKTANHNNISARVSARTTTATNPAATRRATATMSSASYSPTAATTARRSEEAAAQRPIKKPTSATSAAGASIRGHPAAYSPRGEAANKTKSRVAQSPREAATATSLSPRTKNTTILTTRGKASGSATAMATRRSKMAAASSSEAAKPAASSASALHLGHPAAPQRFGRKTSAAVLAEVAEANVLRRTAATANTNAFARCSSAKASRAMLPQAKVEEYTTAPSSRLTRTNSRYGQRHAALIMHPFSVADDDDRDFVRLRTAHASINGGFVRSRSANVPLSRSNTTIPSRLTRTRSANAAFSRTRSAGPVFVRCGTHAGISNKNNNAAPRTRSGEPRSASRHAYWWAPQTNTSSAPRTSTPIGATPYSRMMSGSRGPLNANGRRGLSSSPMIATPLRRLNTRQFGATNTLTRTNSVGAGPLRRSASGTQALERQRSTRSSFFASLATPNNNNNVVPAVRVKPISGMDALRSHSPSLLLHTNNNLSTGGRRRVGTPPLSATSPSACQTTPRTPVYLTRPWLSSLTPSPATTASVSPTPRPPLAPPAAHIGEQTVVRVGQRRTPATKLVTHAPANIATSPAPASPSVTTKRRTVAAKASAAEVFSRLSAPRRTTAEPTSPTTTATATTTSRSPAGGARTSATTPTVAPRRRTTATRV